MYCVLCTNNNNGFHSILHFHILSPFYKERRVTLYLSGNLQFFVCIELKTETSLTDYGLVSLWPIWCVANILIVGLFVGILTLEGGSNISGFCVQWKGRGWGERFQGQFIYR